MLRKRPHIDIYLESSEINQVTVEVLLESAVAQGMNYRGVDLPWSTRALYATAGRSAPLSATAISYSATQCARASNPVWFVDEGLAKALLETEPPTEQLGALPALPYPGVYLDLPTGIFQVYNADTGMHPVWGLYIVEDLYPVDEKLLEGKWERALLISVIGEVRTLKQVPVQVRNHEGNPVTVTSTSLDDAVIYYPVTATKGPTLDQTTSHFSGLAESWRLVQNLLFALDNGTFFLEGVKPQPRDFPRPRAQSRKRHEAHLQKSGKLREFSVIRLSDFARQPKPETSSGRPTGTATRRHVRRGHWHRYWVLDPGEAKVVGTRTRSDGVELYQVYRWLHDITVGSGPEPTKSPRHRLRM